MRDVLHFSTSSESGVNQRSGVFRGEKSDYNLVKTRKRVKKWTVVNTWSRAICGIDIQENHLFYLPSFTLSLVPLSLHFRFIHVSFLL